MPSLLPSEPREPAYLARRQRFGVLPTRVFWRGGEEVVGTVVGVAVAVGMIAGKGTLPRMVGPLLGGLVGALVLGLLERATRRAAQGAARREAVGPESRPRAGESHARSELSSKTERPGPSAGE